MAKRLKTVEAARGLAALAVAFFHANASMQFMGQERVSFFGVGESGVDFFFVLSGFIIAYVHGSDVGKPDRAFDYAAKRFIRLFPILWTVVGSWLVIRLIVGGANPDAMGTSLLLYPSLIKPAPLVVWTLRHELLFYCAFAVLIIEKKWGETLFIAWGLGCLGQLVLSISGTPIMGLPAFFLSSYSLDFMLGMTVAGAHRLFDFRKSLRPMIVGMAAVTFVTLLRVEFRGERLDMLDYVSTGATIWTVALGAAFALLLHGLLCAENIVNVPKALLMLGACSYSLYLVHTVLNSATQHAAAFLPRGLSELLMVGLAVVGGWLLHSRIEKPMSDLLRGALRAHRGLPSAHG